ncbi:MAG TPA: hypothetical protein VHO46_13390 [Bacteroidales bacterium]|nr:hypothetical protein [Bacteroidales bacterium]
MNYGNLKVVLFSSFLLLCNQAGASRAFPAIQDTATFVSAFSEENNKCFKCHGQGKYQYNNESLGTVVTGLMCDNRIIKKDEFYRANHKSFACTDCHSASYETFPHPGELRMEQMPNCLDCHSNDVQFAQYKFEEIDAEYHKSVHAKLESEGFTCWSCHNPHSYRITARNRNTSETIAYDNAICLGCHSDFNRYQLLTEKEGINLIEKHEWLPNQASHFRSVRCIECHAQVSDSLLVSHFVKPKAESVRKCNECHSQNSLLMASLYKYESKSKRKDGFFNGVILNESFVIGANRNQYLNYISITVFLIVIAGVAVHVFFRIKNRKKIKH